MIDQGSMEEFLRYAQEINEPIKVVVAGSREFSDYMHFKNFMYEIVKLLPDFVFMSGMASSGPDKMIMEYAKEYGVLCLERPANWNDIGVPNARIKADKHGRQYNANAGHDRNKAMAQEADFYVIFWDGKSPGTKNMISCCKQEMKYGFIFMV